MSLNRTRTSNLDRITLWIVEDDAPYRNSLSSALGGIAELDCAQSLGTCEEALKALDEGDSPEVILMDIGMPPGKMNGIEATGKIKGLSPATEIIMLTIHGEDANVFKSICAGATGYLLKNPAGGLDEIVTAVKEVALGHQSPINPYIARRVLELFARIARPNAEYELTKREKEILGHIVNGLTEKDIADKLFVSYFTVNTHVKNIYAKLHVHNRSGLIAKVLKEHLLSF